VCVLAHASTFSPYLPWLTNNRKAISEMDGAQVKRRLGEVKKKERQVGGWVGG
jgi:hypothetical protein